MNDTDKYRAMIMIMGIMIVGIMVMCIMIVMILVEWIFLIRIQVSQAIFRT